MPVPDSAARANRRILIIDDNAAIHLDFRKVLGVQAEHTAQAALDVLEANLFGDAVVAAARPNFDIDSAHQGQEGVAMAHQALVEGRPYTMAFVDMRMPPGWDGLKTIERLWATDPDVQVVICSAHTDYDWTEVVARLGHSDRLLVLRKPAEPIEVLQCATALSRKWENDKLVREHVLRLEEVITTRTKGLEAANRQLRHLATHDSLTGLPNRHHRHSYLAQHRHRHVSGRRRNDAGPARARGCGHVLGETARPRQFSALYAGNGRGNRGARSARKRFAQRARAEPVPALLPTQGGYPNGRGSQRGGLDPLAAPDARHRVARGIHPAGRGVRPHRRHRRMGDPGSVPADTGLADRRRPDAAGVGKSVGIAVPRQRPGGQHPPRGR